MNVKPSLINAHYNSFIIITGSKEQPGFDCYRYSHDVPSTRIEMLCSCTPNGAVALQVYRLS